MSRVSRTQVSRRKLVAGAGAAALGATVFGKAPVFAQDRETIKVTSIRYVYGTPPPVDGVGLGMINERFGFDYQPLLVPEATYTEKLTTVIASGDIPDIVTFKSGDSNYYKWASQGAFLDLEPYLADYPNLAVVTPDRLNVVRVDGTLFGMPMYYPQYALTASIRQDWLDNLGLTVPTSYEELKAVALAFTQGDPTGKGESTYGIAVGELVNPSYAMGAYWDPLAWFHKDDQDRLIPGSIAVGSQERIQFLADLYAEGAITRDFAVLDWAATNAEFYGSKAGIFIGAPRGMSQDYYASLIAIAPEALVKPIPAFAAPDGSQGFLAASGTSGNWALSAELAGDEDKLRRILEFLDFARTFYPVDQQVATNADYTWTFGVEGEGYEVVDGKVNSLDSATEPKGFAPRSYFIDPTSWPPTDDAIDYSLGYTQQPAQGVWAKELQTMWTESTPYINPNNGIVSETNQTEGTEISNWVNGEHTKMIAGQRGTDTWAEFVSEYLERGGEQIISETNTGIQERDASS
jgi:putative aldouronate transport system substrate-binding protein